jgi:hypothetical protein
MDEFEDSSSEAADVNWERPSTEQVWSAIEVYLRTSYPQGAPASVKRRLDQLRETDGDGIWDSPAFERTPADGPTKYALRLGSPIYPHMKLVVERSPDGLGHLFRADTHDRHCRPAPDSREYGAYCAMMEENHRIAKDIERAWEAEGVPTFKQFLKADLARRAAAK